jgi:hypothetical protein
MKQKKKPNHPANGGMKKMPMHTKEMDKMMKQPKRKRRGK